MSPSRWTSPRPRQQPLAYRRFTFEVTDDLPLEPIEELPIVDLARLLIQRRSGTTFGHLEPARLEALLAYSLRVVQVSTSDDDRMRRPVPSAGGLHPLHLVVARNGEWRVYLPREHALRRLLVDDAAAHQICAAMQDAFAAPSAIGLLVLAEWGVTGARYEGAESLLLRESGGLLTHLGIVAEALGLSYRILGPTGEPWASRLVREAADRFVGAGTALVGARP